MIGPLRDAELSTGRAFGRALAELGALCWRHARLVVLLWMVATVTAAVFTGKLTERLLSGAGPRRTKPRNRHERKNKNRPRKERVMRKRRKR